MTDRRGKNIGLSAITVPARVGLNLPGKLTRTSWVLPKEMSFEQWMACGIALVEIGSAVQWWIGDWWAYGKHSYGERIEAFRNGLFEGEYTFESLMNYGWVSRAVETSTRVEVLTHRHHWNVAHLSTVEQKKWLARAVKEEWSAAQLRSEIRWQAAREATTAADLEAAKLGKYVVLYADPPWRYEHPPMGGSNRSVENHYPTMTVEELVALPVDKLAYKDAILFLWATNPKLPECMEVATAWGFAYRTNAAWVKDKIGMGYYFREQHELLLVCKRGEFPPPPSDVRISSVINAPRLEHGAKPPEIRDVLDALYPGVPKVELFAREQPEREGWTYWGNEAPSITFCFPPRHDAATKKRHG
jgi:N6-adenosine-specific RNA methylase IME4